MAITQTTHVREILLVRADPDGTWAGSQKKITITSGAGVPIPDMYGDAEPLNVADVGDVLAPSFIALTNERDAALAANAVAANALAEMTADRDAQAQARAEIEAASAAVSAALAAAQARIAELEAAA